ncbi:MAG TPA: GNAT family N-acetyltransferase, partial [Vicinamibacterales bacterium]|nr:GNAT family N-acetyltransferase [Vicinamibacterales bacterium]
VGGIEPAATGADVDQAVARLIAVNEASYKLQGRPLAPQHRAFLYDVCRRFAARGMLSLPILTIGGLDAAYMLGIVERGYFYDVTLAYDEAFARLSPGAHLTQRTLERLAGLGVHTMISHGAHEYKQHWATRFVPQTRLYLFAPGLRASATRFLRFRLMPWWQRLDRNG